MLDGGRGSGRPLPLPPRLPLDRWLHARLHPGRCVSCCHHSFSDESLRSGIWSREGYPHPGHCRLCCGRCCCNQWIWNLLRSNLQFWSTTVETDSSWSNRSCNWSLIRCVLGYYCSMGSKQKPQTRGFFPMVDSVWRRIDRFVRSSSDPLRRSRRPGHHHHGLRGRDAVEEGGVGRSQPCHQDFPEDVDHLATSHLCSHRNRDSDSQNQFGNLGIFSPCSVHCIGHQNVRNLCGCYGWSVECEGEDFHGICLASKGHCSSCIGTNFLGQRVESC